MTIRINFIRISFFLLALLLSLRVLQLQFFGNDKLSKLQERLFSTTIEVKGQRGNIFDRNHRELAVSVQAYSLFADPQEIEDTREVARALAPLLNLSQNHLLTLIERRDRRFVWIQRRLETELYEKIHKKIQELRLKGLGFIPETKRIYPNGPLLSHTLGFVGNDETGLEGIEQVNEKTLSAGTSQFSVARDARGRPLIRDGRYLLEHSDGEDLYLTIDTKLQHRLERELSAIKSEQGAQNAVGVILDPRDSQILALAKVPGYNANTPLKVTSAQRRNQPITDAFEPGSTLKPIIIAEGLQTGLYKANTLIPCEGGRRKIDNHFIRDVTKACMSGELSLTEVLSHSSNVGMTHIGIKLGSQRVYNALKRFGFGSQSGVDFPGEARGILPAPPWRKHFLATVSFGHSITATALQIANAYAVIANGGLLHQPYFNQNLPRPRGQRVISKETAEALKMMLVSATAPGTTGYRSRPAGFLVAGKTGTARKTIEGQRGYSDDYISSFVGFFPIHDPKYVIYIAVDSPQKETYGSLVAAPVFRNLAESLLLHGGLQPVVLHESDLIPRIVKSDSKKKDRPIYNEELSPTEFLTSLQGLPLRRALHTLRHSPHWTKW